MKKVKISKKSCSSFYSEKRTIIQKIVAAGALTLAFLFSLNSYGVVNIINCSGKTNTLEHYNKVLEAQKNNLTPAVRYNLGFTAICIGKYEDGLKHMREASKGGHVVATKILGVYYDKEQSFDNNQVSSIENLYRAITHYEKAANQIEAIPSYPKGSVKDMERMEYVSTVSYSVFTTLPSLHFNIYSELIGDTIDNGTFHPGTLDILQKLGDAATRCLRRPTLSAWKEKKDRVYSAQQAECQAYLDFVTAIYPLEDERIKIANNCTVSVNNCKQHKEKTDQIDLVFDTFFIELEKVPSLLTIAQSS